MAASFTYWAILCSWLHGKHLTHWAIPTAHIKTFLPRKIRGETIAISKIQIQMNNITKVLWAYQVPKSSRQLDTPGIPQNPGLETET